MHLDSPLMDTLPSPQQVRERLGAALREAELLRRLLKISELAEAYLRCLRATGQPARGAKP
jgi:hypothetical protein